MIKFTLNINVTFPYAPCPILSLDIVDITGVHMINLDGRIHKHTINPDGTKSDVQDAVSLLHSCKMSDRSKGEREGPSIHLQSNKSGHPGWGRLRDRG
jgi:hypothetical protein